MLKWKSEVLQVQREWNAQLKSRRRKSKQVLTTYKYLVLVSTKLLVIHFDFSAVERPNYRQMSAVVNSYTHKSFAVVNTRNYVSTLRRNACKRGWLGQSKGGDEITLCPQQNATYLCLLLTKSIALLSRTSATELYYVYVIVFFVYTCFDWPVRVHVVVM